MAKSVDQSRFRRSRQSRDFSTLRDSPNRLIDWKRSAHLAIRSQLGANFVTLIMRGLPLRHTPSIVIWVGKCAYGTHNAWGKRRAFHPKGSRTSPGGVN